jgi:hypothetical protein
LALAAVSLLSFATSASAAPLTSWTQDAGSISSGLNTASPILGNGTSDSADGQGIHAVSSSFSLNTVGDSISLYGGVAFAGLATPQADQFRFGLYNVNGQSSISGWLGYFASNSGTSGGPTYSRLWERNNPNSFSYGSGSGATTISSANATPSNTAFASGSYTFSLTYTRVATGLQIDWTLLGTDVTYSVSGSFLDTTPQTYTFNRVGMFTGGGLNASQVSFSNISLDYTPVPEPAVTGLLLGGSLLFVLRRRRQA